MGPTPLLPTPAKDIVPEGAPISNDDSVVSSVYSQHLEPEGEFRDDDNYDGLFTFLNSLLLQILKMRELDRILYLRETSPSRLMRELLYPLPQILDDGPVVQLASILLLGGFEDQMDKWSESISVSLGT